MTAEQNLGSQLKEIRHRLGLKQGEFASLLEVDQSYLSRVENGRVAPSLRLVKYARSLAANLTKEQDKVAKSQNIDADRFFTDQDYRIGVLMDHFQVPIGKRPDPSSPIENIAITKLTGITPFLWGEGTPLLGEDYRALADLQIFVPENHPSAGSPDQIAKINNRIQYYIDHPDYIEELPSTEKEALLVKQLDRVLDESGARYSSKTENPVYQEIVSRLLPWVEAAKKSPEKAGVMLHFLKKHLPPEDVEL